MNLSKKIDIFDWLEGNSHVENCCFNHQPRISRRDEPGIDGNGSLPDIPRLYLLCGQISEDPHQGFLFSGETKAQGDNLRDKIQ